MHSTIACLAMAILFNPNAFLSFTCLGSGILALSLSSSLSTVVFVICVFCIEKPIICFLCLLFGCNSHSTNSDVWDLVNFTEKAKRKENVKQHLTNEMGFILLGKINISSSATLYLLFCICPLHCCQVLRWWAATATVIKIYQNQCVCGIVRLYNYDTTSPPIYTGITRCNDLLLFAVW